jgi:hypothetical protein
MRLCLPFLCFLLGITTAWSGETRLGLGVFFFAPSGVDLQAGYQFGESPWAVELRYVRWTDTFHDPFTGHALSETTESHTGLLGMYLFQPRSRGSWYVQGGLVRWEKEEKSLINGDTSPTATTSPAIGGGYTHAIGTSFYWNAGLFLSPGVTMNTKTSTGSESDSGAFDIQLQVGVRF